MKEININKFLSTEEYQEFIKDNSVNGYLKIRAYTASGAVPIKDLNIEVSKEIENNKVIFYKGLTDESGIIERITLPICFIWR